MSNKLSDNLGIVAVVSPLLRDDATGTSTWAGMAKHGKIMFVCAVGATDTTVDVKLQEATDSSGTGAADISGKAVTQLGATDDNKQVIIEVDASELSDGFDYVACLVTSGNGTLGADTCVIAISGDSRYKPASGYDLATVAQIVS